MKRIYMALALVGALAAETKAQSIDLGVVIGLPDSGQVVGPHQTLDTTKVLCGIYYNGPDQIQSGDAVYFMTSFSRPGTQPGSYYMSGVQFNQPITSADSGQFILIFPNANQIGMGHIAPYKLASDSIRLLVDWDQWATNDSIVAAAPPYVNGKAYGFYFRVVKLGDGSGNTIGSDPNPSNNIAIQKIVWNSSTGIQEFAQKEKATISAYPNPAIDVINFDFNFDAPTHSTVLIRDINGRMVYSKNYGRTNAGNQKYSVDISKLSTGTYTLELDSDNQHAATKFSKK